MTAPPATDPSASVAEVVVRAARLPDPAGDAAFSVVAVGRDELQDRRDVDDALKTAAGFSLYRRTSTLGANPTTEGVSLRAIAGSGASRALVTLDGVPQNDPFGGWVIWTALPPDTLDGARLVRGAGAGPYGAGALTGVVQLEGADSFRGATVAGSVGGLDYRQGSAALGADVGGTRVLLGASGQDSGGWIPVREGRGAADRPLDLHAWSASGRAERDVGPAVVAVRLAAYEEDRGAGQVGAASRASGVNGSITAAVQPTQGGLGWRLQAWGSGSDLYNSSASLSADRDLSTPANIQYATPAIGWGLNAALRALRGPLSLEVGTDVRGATGESRELFSYAADGFTRTRKAGGQTLVAGVYGEATTTRGPWLLTANLRADEWANFGAERVERTIGTGALLLDDRPKDRDGVLPTGRLGLKRQLPGAFGGLAWRAAAYAGFRPATLNELHRPFRQGNNVTEADPSLDPERLYGIETGLDYARGALTASATLFRNRLEDAITNVTVGQGPATFPIAGFVPAGGTLRMRENAGAIDATGLEAEARRDLASGRGDLHASLAWTDTTVDGGTQAPQLDGKRPALTPRVTATAGVRWRIAPPLQAALDARYESVRFDDDLNTLRLRPALTADLRVDYAVRAGLSLYVAADNLFDAGVQTAETAGGVYSYDAPRLVRVGLRITR